MSRTRKQLVAQVGAEIGRLIAGARAVTNRAAVADAADLPWLRPATCSTSRASCAQAGPRAPPRSPSGSTWDKGALSRLLSDLEAAGLVAKRPHPEDGRASAVALTPAGEKRLAGVLADKGAELTDRLARFDEGELAALASLLRRLNEP